MVKIFKKLVEIALEEDGVQNDVTSSCVVSKNIKIKANIIAKQYIVVSGLYCIKDVIEFLDKSAKVKLFFKEGDCVEPCKIVASIFGKAKEVLSSERTILNILGRLCGIATMTRKYVEAVKGTGVSVMDTRKTYPGLRFEEKMAVKAGGGVNHRFGLTDMVLIKDNHLAFLRLSENLETDAQAIDIALDCVAGIKIPVQIEVKNKQELEMAIKQGANFILIDNMKPSDVKSMVKMADSICSGLKIKKPIIEYSGGVNLKNVIMYAHSGVDRISIGALTHSAPSVDLSMEIVGV
jgi:nicotinate-nucleotide pyrophosphorylase (carboxylating)